MSLLETENEIGKSISTEFCHSISIDGLFVSGMRVVFSPNQLLGVIASIKNKLINIILKIDKDFGNLDTLDTFVDETDSQALQSIENYIINVIFDKSITIGNGNKFKATDIGHKGG